METKHKMTLRCLLFPIPFDYCTLSSMRLRNIPLIQWAILFLIVFGVLWRGGKSLDATLILALGASVIAFWNYFERKTISYHRQTLLSRSIIWTAAALVIWTLISFIYSSTRNYGFDELLQTTSLFLLLCVTMDQTKEDPAFKVRFAKTIASVTLIACGIGLVVYCLQPVNRAVGTFFDWRFHTDYWPNAWAEYLLLAWPLALWSVYRSSEKRSIFKHAIGIGVLGLILGSLFLSFSRGGLLTLIAQLFILGGLMLWHRGWLIPWKKVLVHGSLIVIVGILVFAGTNQIRSQFNAVESVVKKATLSSDEGSSSVTERVQFWKQAAMLAAEKPILGFGPYSFRFIQPELQTEVLATSDHAHNVFLKLAMERGMPAAGLMLLIVMLAVIGGMKRIVNCKMKIENCDTAIHPQLPATSYQLPVPSNQYFLTICFLVSLLGVLLHNLIDYNLQFVGICLPFWMTLGFLGSTTKSGEGIHFPERWLQIIVAMILLPATLFCSWQLMEFSLARRALISGRTAEALQIFSAIHSPLFPRDDQLTQASLEMSEGLTDAARTSLDAYFKLNQKDTRAWSLLGSLQRQTGDTDGALWSYRRAFELGRWNDVGITRALMTLLEQKKEDRDRIRPSVDALTEKFAAAIERNSHFIGLSPNVEECIALLNLLAKQYPSDAPHYQDLAKRIENKAMELRLKTAARPRGVLW